jgi:peptide-methionine (S)-S-oxide reductase
MANIQEATLGAGCFWCVEAVFQELKGVQEVFPAYANGHVDNPTYEQVCAKTTGHAEVCRLVFDGDQVSFDEILEVFFKTHDPTTLNRQGNDVGPQYRSGIYYHDEEQEKTARSVIEALEANKVFPNPIVTEVEPLGKFFRAEDYHNDYYLNNGNRNPYCTFVVRPKVEKFRKAFAGRLKGD